MNDSVVTMRFPASARIVLIALLLLALGSTSASGQQAPALEAEGNVDPGFDRQQRARWLSFYQREASAYTFYTGSDRGTKLRLSRDPVLVYTNPVGERGLTHGAVFVWTHEGRCEVVGAIWSLANTPKPDQRTVAHEFHSLSSHPLTAHRHGEDVWSTKGAGLEWIAAPDAPALAPSPFGRLTQMRAIARQLAVTRYSDQEDSRQRLRLLSQPVFRRDTQLASTSDAALFAYCVVWDPEAFVMIEARESGNDLQWFYAPVRFSHLTLAVHCKEQEVWRDTRGEPSHSDPALGYKLFYNTSVQDETLESGADETETPR